MTVKAQRRLLGPGQIEGLRQLIQEQPERSRRRAAAD
jgi:hypothetical protein